MLAVLPRLSLRIIVIAFSLAALVPAAAAAQARPSGEPYYMPWEVVDRIVAGNVIDVRRLGLVRLAGVDDGGELSRAFLAGILSTQAVRVIATPHSSNGMTEAFVYTPDGRCVNTEMLRLGYARVRVTPDFERLAEFTGLQQDAQRLKRGLWADAPVAGAAAPPAVTAPQPPARRFHLAAGGGATAGRGSGWIAGGEIGVAVTRAVGLYLAGGYIDDLGDADGSHASHAGAGIRLLAPARVPVRPYLRGGGGYMRIESGGTARRDRPFWEAGAGLLLEARRAHVDLGYTFARADGIDVTRAFGLIGLRF